MAGSAVQFGRMSIGVVVAVVVATAAFSGAFAVAAGTFSAHVVEKA